MKRYFFLFVTLLGSILTYGQSYKVGDLYSKYGYKGIVFYVDSSGTHGKIISLHDTYGDWAINVNFDNMYGSKFVGASDFYDGRNNTQVIKGVSNWKRCFPVFREIDKMEGNWYMPSREELMQIAKVHQKLNKTLSMYGYGTLTGNYYSSTEATNETVWNVWVDNGRIDVYEVYKEGQAIKSRAITTF